MAASLSYAKIVRNQRNEENCTSEDNSTGTRSVNMESETRTDTLDVDKKDPSFSEVDNSKKVCLVRWVSSYSIKVPCVIFLMLGEL